jgi:hypothetical protein
LSDTVRRCGWPGCGALLAHDNRGGCCSHHPEYEPEFDPALYARLLDYLIVHRGERCDVCSAFGVRTFKGRRAVRKQVEKARRHGHYVLGSRAGWYIYQPTLPDD